MRNIFRLAYQLILKAALQRPLRYFLTILGIASGMSLYFSVKVINFSAVRSLETNVESMMGNTDLTIKSISGTIPQAILEKVEATPGVRYATGIITESTYFYREGHEKQRINILAVDLLKEGPFRNYQTENDEDIIDDPIEFLNTPNGIIITKDFAQKYSLEIEDEFDLLTAQGKKTFQVGGVLSQAGVAKAFGGGIAVMDLMASQFLFNKIDQMTSIDVILDDRETIKELKEHLQKTLGTTYQVQGQGEQIEGLKKMTASYRKLLDLIGLVTWFIGLFVVHSSISLSVTQKMRELGILRAVGSDKMLNVFLFLVEAGFLGLIGSLLAILLGTQLSGLMLDNLFASMEDQFKLSLGRNLFDFPLSYYSSTLLLGILTSLLAAIFPAWKATEIDPLKVIKNEGLEYRDAKVKLPWMELLLGLLLFGYFYFSSSKNLYSQGGLFQMIHPLSGVLGLLLLLRPSLWLFLKGILFYSQKFGVEFWMATKNAWENFRSYYQNALRLTLSLVFILFLMILQGSLSSGFIDYFDTSRASDYGIMSDSDMFNMQIVPFDGAVLKDVLTIQGIKSLTSDQLLLWRQKEYFHQGLRIGVNAVNGQGDLDFFLKKWGIVKTSNDFNYESFWSKESSSLGVSTSLAKKQNYELGDRFIIETPFAKKEFTIVALYVDYAEMNGSILMNLATFRDLFRDNLISIAGLNIMDGYDREKVLGEIESMIAPIQGIRLIRYNEVFDEFKKKINASFAFVDGIMWASLFITFIGLFTPTLFQIISRQREFGIVLSYGLSFRGLMKLLIQEYALFGFFGLLYTLSVGLIFNSLFYKTTLVSILIWDFPLRISFSIPLTLVVLSILLAVLPLIYPLLMMRKKSIKDMVSYE